MKDEITQLKRRGENIDHRIHYKSHVDEAEMRQWLDEVRRWAERWHIDDYEIKEKDYRDNKYNVHFILERVRVYDRSYPPRAMEYLTRRDLLIVIIVWIMIILGLLLFRQSDLLIQLGGYSLGFILLGCILVFFGVWRGLNIKRVQWYHIPPLRPYLYTYTPMGGWGSSEIAVSKVKKHEDRHRSKSQRILVSNLILFVVGNILLAYGVLSKIV